MNALQHINITAEILCLSICLILLLCIATADNRKEKLNRIFLYVVCCHIPLLLVDTAIFVLGGRPHSYFIFRTSYFLSFILGAVLLILFTHYLITYIGTKTTVSRKTIYVSYVAVAACGINIFFVILTQFTGLYYFIDAGNVFRHGDFYWLSQLSALLCIVINTGIILTHRRHFETRETIFLLSYAALPMLAIFIQNMVNDTIASIDVATTLTILIFYAGIQSEQDKRLKEKEVELTNSRIAIMLSQIQPHFLYNSLTAIKQLYRQDLQKGEETLLEFSNYLRGNMDSLTFKTPIPFDKELHHVKTYLSIEKKRFGDKLTIEYNINARDFMLPAMTLQPIVENAIRNGVTKREDGGTVTIATAETETEFALTVTDDGVGFDPGTLSPSPVPKQDGGGQNGIENVRSRLDLMCGGKLVIHSEPDVGTTVVITIPKGETNI